MARRPNTFKRQQRLHKPDEFDRVFREGHSAADDLLVVYALPNELPRRRLGIVAGKRLGGAVDRNRAKRLIREAFRTTAEQTACGLDFVVIPRKITCNASFEAVKSSFAELARKLVQSWQE